MTTATDGARISAMPDRFRIRDDGSAVLVGTRCDECGTHAHGERGFCPRCGSDHLAPVELSSVGSLLSYTYVVRVPAGWTGPDPYALAEVLLPEDVVVTSRVGDWGPGQELEIGSRYEVAAAVVDHDEAGREIVVYVFNRHAGAA